MRLWALTPFSIFGLRVKDARYYPSLDEAKRAAELYEAVQWNDVQEDGETTGAVGRNEDGALLCVVSLPLEQV